MSNFQGAPENIGREALMFFHNQAMRFPDNYKMSFDQLISYVKSLNKYAVEGLGDSILANSMETGDVRDAMERLADNSKGRVPTNWMTFSRALVEEITDHSLFKAVSFTVVESAKDVGTGLVKTGETLLTTLKGLGIIFPILVIGGAIYFYSMKVKKWSA